MREFIDFAKSYGLIMQSLELHKWVRVATVGHPKKRNGAYKFVGTAGWVRDHATMTEPVMWKPGAKAAEIDMPEIRRMQADAAAELSRKRFMASERAQRILDGCYKGTHPYLLRKGFPTEQWNVFHKGEQKILCIPMWVGSDLVGLQMINEAGDKKFLLGQRTKLAVFPLGSGGRTILCEGFATGLSIRAALATIPGRHWIAVCFSAGNLLEVAKTRPGALVVADNDVSGTGQRVANDSKLPYWLSETEGHDFNDDMQALGVFQVSQSLRSALSQK